MLLTQQVFERGLSGLNGDRECYLKSAIIFYFYTNIDYKILKINDDKLGDHSFILLFSSKLSIVILLNQII